MNTPYTRTEEFVVSREAEEYYEGLAQAKTDELQNNKAAVECVNPQMIERAWKEQVQAVDRWEWLAERNFPKDEIERAWEHIQECTAVAVELEELYQEQYEMAVA